MRFQPALVATILGILFLLGQSQCTLARAEAPPTPQAHVVSVEITPGTGEIALQTTMQLAAIAKYSDGTTRDVTKLAAWTSSSGAVLAVDAEGLVTGLQQGTATIFATFESHKGAGRFASNPQLSTFIFPATAVISPGAQVQYTATAWFFDGNLQNVTNSVTWSVVETSIATVSNKNGSKGLVTGVAPGMATVLINSFNAAEIITVSNAALFPPTNVYATGSDGQVQLNWTAASGATSYNVMRSATAGGPYTQIGTAVGPPYFDSGLTDGTSYFYVITSSSGQTQSGNSNEACGTPLAAGVASNAIQHVVIIIKENRSFDTMFGTFPGANGATQGQIHTGQTIQLGHTPDSMPRDISHTWNSALDAMDAGRMDRFDVIPGGNENGDYLSMTQFQQSDIPNYWSYAQNFVLSDANYSGTHANSFPAHVYFAGAQSPAIANPEARYVNSEWGCGAPTGTNVPLLSASGQLTTGSPCFNFSTLADSINNSGGLYTWASYAAPSNNLGYIWAIFRPISHIYFSQQWQNNVFPEQNFANDAENGLLPTVTWLTPLLNVSEHPPESTCVGENWTVEQINAIMQGPNWSSTVIFLLWDDFGGFYDHVFSLQNSIFGLGLRVPLLIISPYSKQVPGCQLPQTCGTITHTTYQFASIFRFVETVFGVQSLNAADVTANDMLDSFNFSQQPVAGNLLTTRQCP